MADGFVIKELWAYVQVGDDGDEGVLAELVGDSWIPLIGADEVRMQLLRPTAMLVAHSTGRAVTLRHFRDTGWSEAIGD